MKMVKFIRQAFIRSVKYAGLLLQIIADLPRQRQQQTVFNELEAERLDRICNPSKYRGKDI